MAEKRVLKLAARLSRRYWDDYQEYLEKVESDRRKGFRAEHCEHGTYQWVDWDPICGPCEDGWSMENGVHRRRRALDEAQYRIERVAEMRRVLSEAVTVLGPWAVNTDKVIDRITDLMTV